MKYYQFDFRKLLQIQLLKTETLIPPQMHITRYASEYIMYVMTEGVMKLEVNGVPHTYVPGDVVLFSKGDFHKPVESTYCKYYYVHFLSDGITEMEMDESTYIAMLEEKRRNCFKVNVHSLETYDYVNAIVAEKYSIPDHNVFSHITRTLSDHCLSYRSKFPQNRLAASRAFEDVLMRLESLSDSSGSDRTDKLIADISAYVEKNYAVDFHGNDLEQRFYINYDYANRVFSKAMGCSIFRYRNQIRINEAKVKLLTTDLSVSEIAGAVGINSLHYFSRLFKEREGLSPTEYRVKSQRA